MIETTKSDTFAPSDGATVSSTARTPRPARRRAALALLALGAALGAPGAGAAAPGALIELADVGDRAIHLASTFTSESLVVTNTSTAGEAIAAIEIDLADGPAMFPDLVFDPAGTGGDTQGKGVTLDSVTGIVVLAAPPGYGNPAAGGFASATITFPVDEEPGDAFGDFEAGSVARFSFDVDPTSIQGTPPEPVPAAAPVSGAELHGATVTVTFADGTILSGDLALTPGTANSSRLVLAPETPLAEPALARGAFRGAPAITFDPSQEIVVSGPPGAGGVLVVAEGHLNVVDAPGGGFDLDPFEANTAAAIAEVPFTIGPAGTVSVMATLSDTPGQLPLLPLRSGVNFLTAHLVDGPRTGPVSDPLVLQLDADAERIPPTVAFVFPAQGASVPVDARPSVVFSEPMDPGTVAAPGVVTLTGPEGPVPLTLVAGDEAAEFTIVPGAPLSPGGAYTLTVAASASDAVGNPLTGGVASTFSVQGGPIAVPDPACASAPSRCAPPPSGAAAPACATVPERPAPPRVGRVALTAAQLRTGQRIAQAALRRANAIESWLAAGIRTTDLCGGALGPGEFAGITFGGTSPVPVVAAAPRPLVVAPAPGRRAGLALTAAQMRINQRIAQAALRRAGALAARLDGGLTGGDVADGAVGAPQLWSGLVADFATAAAPVPATVTAIPAPPRTRDRVTLSAAQARINRRIAIEAMRRVNELADRLARGLTGADVRDGSLTAADLAPEARP